MKNISVIALLVIYLLFLVVNLCWLGTYSVPPEFDSAKHASISLKFSRSIENKNIFTAIKDIFINPPDSRYPPITYIVAHLFYKISGRVDILIAILSINLVFLPLLIFSSFGVGRIIKDNGTGFLAGLFIMLFPATIAFNRHFLLELPVLAMFMWSLYTYIRSNYLNSSRYSLLFGISVGMGLLTKSQYFTLIIPVFIYSLIDILFLYKDKNEFRRKCSNLAYAVALAVFIASFWYINNLQVALHKFYWFENASLSNPHSLFRNIFRFKALLANMRFYLFIIQFYTSLPFLFIFLTALIICLKNARNKHVPSLIFFLVFIFVAISSLPFRDCRYIFPLLGVLGIITVFGLAQIRSDLLRKIMIWIAVFFSLFNFINTSYSQRITKITVLNQWWGELYTPFLRQEDWKVRDVVKLIGRESSINSSNNEKTCFIFGFDHSIYNYCTINYYCLLDSLNYCLIDPVYSNLDFKRSEEKDLIMVDQILEKNNYRYIIYKDGKNFSWFGLISRRLGRLGAFIMNHKNNFKIIYKSVLPDGSNVVVYKRIE